MEGNTTLDPLGSYEHENVSLEATVASLPDFEPVRLFYFIAIGIIIPAGFICNSLSIAVFVSSKLLRKSTTGLYLVALAVADTLYLVGELLRWLDKDKYVHGYEFTSMSDATCRFVFSLRYGAKLTSAWITVAITTERFLIVTFPLRAGRISTKKIAFAVIAVVYCSCFFLGCYSIFSIGLGLYKGKPKCLISDHKWYNIGSWVVLRVGSLLLPGIIVIVLTVVIIVYLTKARIQRQNNLNESRGHGRTKHSKKSTEGSVERQLTAMLLAVAIAFIILRLPYTVLFYVNEYKEEIWGEGLTKWNSFYIYAVTKGADVFAALNYAVNFFLYCLSGSTFRSQFLKLFHCESTKKSSSLSSVTAPPTGDVVEEKANRGLVAKGRGLVAKHGLGKKKDKKMNGSVETQQSHMDSEDDMSGSNLKPHHQYASLASKDHQMAPADANENDPNEMTKGHKTEENSCTRL